MVSSDLQVEIRIGGTVQMNDIAHAWEQRKLNVVCDVVADGDWIESKDQNDSGVRLIQTGNIGLGEYTDKPDNKKWVSKETFVRLKCFEVFPGDILISRLPEPAGRACIIPELSTRAITAVDCTIIRTSKADIKFLLQALSSKKYFNYVTTCLAGGTRQRVSRKNLEEYSLELPENLIEQQCIGDVFDKITTLITLHQRKVEKLKNIKKALLEKMFV